MKPGSAVLKDELKLVSGSLWGNAAHVLTHKIVKGQTLAGGGE